MGTSKDQITLAQELMGLLLQDFVTLIKSGKASPTDRATMARFLKENDFRISPDDFPEDLKSAVDRIRRQKPLPTDLPADTNWVVGKDM